MWKQLLCRLFKGRPVEVPDIDRLAEGEARGVTLGDLAAGGVKAVLCRVEGRVFALDSLCPHEGGRIETGPLVEGRFARCPLHGFLFDPKDGSVVRGACRKAKTYRVEVREGRAILWIS